MRVDRMACAWLRRFPLLCLRIERPALGEGPVAVYREEAGRTRVLCASREAERLGVIPGVSVSDARARVPALRVVAEDPRGQRRRLEELGEALLEFGPRVMPLPPDGLVVEVGGSAPLFGGEEAIARAIGRRLEGMGVPARVVVADGWHASRALAEFGPWDARVIPPGREVLRRALGPLRLEALMPAIECHFDGAHVGVAGGRSREVRGFIERFVHGFDTLGVRRVRDLAALAEGDVAERWGPPGRALHRRACAWPEAPLASLAPSTQVRECLELEGACQGWGPLQRHLGRLLRRVSLRLQARGEAALRLRLETLHHPDGVGELSVDLARATRCPRVLQRVLRERLERWETDPGGARGPITQLVAVVEEVERAEGAQLDLVLAAERRGEEVAELVERLRASLGPEAVFGAVLVDRWRPEGAWVPSPSFPPPAGAPDPPGMERPLALFDAPGRIPGPIARLGPLERLAGEWWEDDGGFRRSCRSALLDDGARVWLWGEGFGGRRGGAGPKAAGLFD